MLCSTVAQLTRCAFPLTFMKMEMFSLGLAEGEEGEEKCREKGGEGEGDYRTIDLWLGIVAAAQRWWQVSLSALAALFVCLPRACLSCIALLEGNCVC